MRKVKLETAFDIVKIFSQESDFKQIPKGVLAKMAFEIFLIREFETALLQLWEHGCVHGPVHTSIGQEGCAAGAVSALNISDKISSTHRAHHHYLSKAVSFYSEVFSPLGDNIPEGLQQEITSLMGEIMGLSIGCCGGRGGSMHLRNEKIGVTGTNAIVAGGIPLATGASFAAKYRNTKEIVVSFLGDGAVNQGAFHEALNLAGIWKLPAVYFIENNLYAVGTSINDSTVTGDLAVKGISYGINGIVVDGMDPVSVYMGLQQAAERARRGDGATLVEAKCYRFFHHAGPIAGSNFGYREKTEEDNWKCLDPVAMFPQKLMELNILSETQIEQIRQKAVCGVNTARDYCTTADSSSKVCVREELWPNLSTIKDGLRGSGGEFAGIEFVEEQSFTEFEKKTYVEAIASVTDRWLEKDDGVFVLGEEIANFGGGPYGATKGLSAKYPGRVLNTPISEAGFTGIAGGAAMSGLRPVVEIMFPDFALVAADQLFNQIGKLRHMYGNSTDMPVVVRTRIAIGCGYGGQHSMDPSGLFSLFSGWTILAPSNAFDYTGLFNSAMQSNDPVLMLEHHELYPIKGDVPKNNLDYFVQIGKANIVRDGTDVTVLSYSKMLEECKIAAENLEQRGISVELVDLRTISPHDMDYKTIGDSFKKTNTMVIVEQAPENLSIGSKIASQCQARFFDYLDGPIVTVCGMDIPNPVSQKLEQSAVPSLARIEETIYKAAKRQL